MPLGAIAASSQCPSFPHAGRPPPCRMREAARNLVQSIGPGPIKPEPGMSPSTTRGRGHELADVPVSGRTLPGPQPEAGAGANREHTRTNRPVRAPQKAPGTGRPSATRTKSTGTRTLNRLEVRANRLPSPWFTAICTDRLAPRAGARIETRESGVPARSRSPRGSAD